MKVDNSLWRCTTPVVGSATGECDAVVVQQDMEDHLQREHGKRNLVPFDVVACFVLVRTAEVKRGGEPRGKIEDATMTMFDRGEFR